MNRRPFTSSQRARRAHDAPGASAQSIARARTASQSETWTLWTWAALAGGAALAVLMLTGCNPGERQFGKINGQIVTEKEYVQQLERQNVTVPGAPPTNAERVVIDQLIGNRTILSEASKNGVIPTNEEINAMFDTQKKLYAQQFPGKSYDTAMTEQGTTPDELKSDLRVQLAETALYAKLLKLDESEVRSTYEKFKTQLGLPARIQARVIAVGAKSPEFTKAQSELAAGKSFEEVAKEVNPLPLRASGGMLPQLLPTDKFPPALQSKVGETPEGKYFGPIDSKEQNGVLVKEWIKIEKKLPEYKIPYENAAPLVRRQLVQMKLQDPKNQAIRNDILQKKLQATFDTTDKSYMTVWSAVKDAAVKAGVGQNIPASAAPAAAPAGVPGAVPSGK